MLALTALGCSLPQIRECPCADGWYCEEPEMRCVRGEAPDAGVDAEPIDAPEDVAEDVPEDVEPPDTGPAGPVAQYDCDELIGTIMEDATGNGHDARCDAAGCPTLVDDAERGTVCEFADLGGSTGERLRVSHDEDFVSDAFTIALWVNPTGARSGSVIGKPYASGRANSWQLFMVRSGEQLLARFVSAVCPAPEDDCPSEGGEMITGLAGTAVPTSAWSHVALVWDGTTQFTFIDGVEVESEAGDIDFDTRDITIGADDNTGVVDLPYPGMVDDIRIYDRALEAAELAALAGVE